jgi:hypothetical protein
MASEKLLKNSFHGWTNLIKKLFKNTFIYCSYFLNNRRAYIINAAKKIINILMPDVKQQIISRFEFNNFQLKIESKKYLTCTHH